MLPIAQLRVAKLKKLLVAAFAPGVTDTAADGTRAATGRADVSERAGEECFRRLERRRIPASSRASSAALEGNFPLAFAG